MSSQDGNASTSGGTNSGGSMEVQRQAANAAVAGHSATEVVKGKEHWLYFTLPEQPVAGADAVIYLNNNLSDSLRCAHSGHHASHS